MYRSPYTFSVKPKWWTVIFWFFVAHLLGWSVFTHVAPLRTLYGRGYKALWRFCGNMVACTRGVCRQPFSTPPGYRVNSTEQWHSHTKDWNTERNAHFSCNIQARLSILRPLTLKSDSLSNSDATYRGTLQLMYCSVVALFCPSQDHVDAAIQLFSFLCIVYCFLQFDTCPSQTCSVSTWAVIDKQKWASKW